MFDDERSWVREHVRGVRIVIVAKVILAGKVVDAITKLCISHFSQSYHMYR